MHRCNTMQFLFDSDDSANPERNCLHTAAWQPPKKDKQGNKRERDKIERERDIETEAEAEEATCANVANFPLTTPMKKSHLEPRTTTHH
mmetsp:Transcript_87051/g.182201  ORF Transcript_87051/g.182201 Transcript_87051/m.182201 type:complete len:89 (+) Transcript_87051:45-311(+)